MPGERLDSWKEIAQHIGRDVRTAQRWEHEKGLPVHRVPGGHRSAVFAYTSEIDAWLSGQPESLPNGQDPKRFPARWLMLGASLGVLLIVIGTAAYVATRPSSPIRATITGTQLVTLDAAGRTAWVHDFGHLLTEAENPERSLHMADLDGDGQREVIAMATPTFGASRGTQSTTVYCFSSDGRELWRYAPEQIALRFGQQEFTGPWQQSHSVIVEERGGAAVWVAYVHHTWWPSFLVRIDARGQAEVRFFQSGWSVMLGSLRTSAGSYVLAGGINNEYDTGSLAVIKTDSDAAAVSPQTVGSPFHCENCAAGPGPYRYFLFPRSELNRAVQSSANFARNVLPYGDHAEIRTEELQIADISAAGIFDLSANMELTGATFTDLYWDLHRRLEKQGKVRHPAEDCPDRKSGRVARVWRPGNGWSEIRVPYREGK